MEISTHHSSSCVCTVSGLDLKENVISKVSLDFISTACREHQNNFVIKNQIGTGGPPFTQKSLPQFPLPLLFGDFSVSRGPPTVPLK